SMDDVREWFKTYYGPSNTVIVLAGDIDAKTAKEKVEKYFGDIPSGPPTAHQEVWVAKMTSTHRQIVQDRVPQARIYKIWNIPPYGTADADYLNLVSDVLSQGKTSRFYKRLVYDDQIATDAFAFTFQQEIGSQFRIQSTARPDKSLAEVEKALNEELARFLKDGPTPEELQRVKTQYAANFVRGIERIGGFGGKSDRLAQNQVFLGSPDAYKITLKRVQEATADDLKAAANRWLTDGVYILEVHPFPPFKNAAAGVDRSKLPEPGTPPELKLPKLQRATLANGVKVILAERHETPLVNVWMVLDAGYAADQFASPGTASMTANLLDGGTTTRTALRISDQLAMQGARLNAGANLDSSFVNLSALKSNLDGSLEIFADEILNPVFPESDFKRIQKQQLAAIKREESQPIQMALRVFPGLIYGAGHAYSNPLTGSGTPESVGKLTREDLIKFHSVWFHPNNATIIVVGDTTLAEIKPKLDKLFAGWKPGTIPKKNVGAVQMAAKPVVYLMDKPGALQSTIMAGHVAPPRANPKEVALEALNDAFGGSFGSRINMNLRENKHWSYGTFSLLWDARGQRPFIALAPVQTDKTKESLAELNKELRGIVGDKPMTAEELSKVQANETLSLPGSRETIDSVSESIQQQVEFGLPDDYYETLAGKIRALKTSDVADAAKTLIHPDNLVWVVVGDRAKIEAGVRELNLGEIRILDASGKPQ
ncbi:MAG: M16 family metallopeptidase, partial [Terriglobales bacterium]